MTTIITVSAAAIMAMPSPTSWQQPAQEFREAVDQLAAEAGLEVPRSPEANAVERRRLDLAAVLQAAEESYTRRLFGPEGKQALAYLRGRGLTDETIKRFGLGWSGDARGALGADLARQGITTAQLIEAGLLRQDQQSDRVTDQFYRRIMFPIRDRRGRPVSFGGRILGSGEPKYVNGPETPLFAKRRTLYGLDLAREGVAKGERLIVVEGYMDVIALHQAGFGGAVAPLGTSLTDEHLDEIWRLAPSPILCFDGDAAGGKAAARAIEMALPILAPDRTLRIVTLPNGEDPDSLVQHHGFAMFDHALHTAAPLSTALYHVMREQVGDATPEQRAMLRRRLEDAAKGIPDKGLATEYRRALLDRFFDRPMAGRPAPAGPAAPGTAANGRHRGPPARPGGYPAASSGALGRARGCLRKHRPAALDGAGSRPHPRLDRNQHHVRPRRPADASDRRRATGRG